MAGKIETQAKEILAHFPLHRELPASISGKYHLGETCEEHLERCASIMRHLCDAFNIKGSDRDMLIACAYLHDLGTYHITLKGNFETGRETERSWKHFKDSGYSRSRALMHLHPLISALLLDDFTIDRKEEIQDIISAHMAHWYSHTPQPTSFYQRLLVTADYLSTRPGSLFEYTGCRDEGEFPLKIHPPTNPVGGMPISEKVDMSANVLFHIKKGEEAKNEFKGT